MGWEVNAVNPQSPDGRRREAPGYLHRAVLRAVEAAHGELAVLQHQVGGRGVVEVQVAQHVAVGVQHAGPEGGADVRAALLTLGRAGQGHAQRQVGRHFTAASTQTHRHDMHTHTHTDTHTHRRDMHTHRHRHAHMHAYKQKHKGNSSLIIDIVNITPCNVK